jgi:hypothetical protein
LQWPSNAPSRVTPTLAVLRCNIYNLRAYIPRFNWSEKNLLPWLQANYGGEAGEVRQVPCATCEKNNNESCNMCNIVPQNDKMRSLFEK